MVTNSDLTAAVALFESAIVEAPKFPLPYASLCRYYVNEYRKLRSIQAFELAERFCFRALTLDDGLAQRQTGHP